MPRRPLSAPEKRDWLRLARTSNVGPITFCQLIRRFGSASAALDAIPEIVKRGGNKKFVLPAVSSVEDELERIEKIGAKLVAWCEPDYPESLAAIEDAPPLITLRGHPHLLLKPCIGMVGARNASLNGRKMAEALAADLGKSGFVVVSGMARGIDGAAHGASLATGTIAVLAGGVDVVYPEENRRLYEKLVDVGCIVSDMPMGLEPFSQLFPRRNRIISGLSLGVIVVEAALQSGSLITARMALDQGREVFAVPGSPLDPRAKGTNDLLRQGAVLTERVSDILNHISTQPRLLSEPPANDYFSAFGPVDGAALASGREKILENLSTCPVSVDELTRQCHLSPEIVLTVLLELELIGQVERQVGNKVSLIGASCLTSS